jgi:hypothetical protein
MPSQNSITPKIINLLQRLPKTPKMIRFSLSVLLIICFFPAFSQDNSPYSRYGMGDAVPSTNVSSRSMGGISAAYNDPFSINFNNPASYGSFQAFREANSKKMTYGRAILDVGMNFENRTLRAPSSTEKFTASNVLFSHVQLGLPIRPNWGLSFGLRPLSRISYKISKTEQLFDPNTGLVIDSAGTLNQGDGGSYMASLGTGFKIDLNKVKSQSISFGINGGYLFGRKDYSTRRTILNDTVQYTSGNAETKTSFGNINFNGGFQYQALLKKKTMALTIGVYGNWKQNLNATQDIIRETYVYDETAGNTRLDSVSDKTNIKGTIVYPSSYTAGVVFEKFPSLKTAGWLVGVDFAQHNWDEYRFYDQVDNTVKSNWELRIGGQLTPVPKTNYFSNVRYRAGIFMGPDYIHINRDLPVMGASFGLGLPLVPANRQINQVTFINLGFEYIKRGNNDNLLKENLFRMSIGLSLSDLWFSKKKYD